MANTEVPIPEQAITDALKAAPDQHISLGHWEPIMSRADMRRTLEAAAPAIRDQERQRLFGNGDSENYHGLVKLTRADAALAERVRWLSVLADHYLASVECDPVTNLDNSVCGCSRVFLGWHPSIGEARQAWIDHVDGIVSTAHIAGDEIPPDAIAARVAELEQLTRDILSRYTQTSDGYRARTGQVQIAKWRAVLNGSPAEQPPHPPHSPARTPQPATTPEPAMPPEHPVHPPHMPEQP